jgi:beta-1,4-N-acetylglucosaminyltransferase
MDPLVLKENFTSLLQDPLGWLKSFFTFFIFLISAWYISILCFRKKRPKSILVILGSGGHTSEILKVLEDWEGEINAVCAENDLISARQFNDRFSGRVHFVYRSRRVGQSYFSSIFTTIYSFFPAFAVIWKESPSLIVTNGPGTALPLCYVGFFMRFLTLQKIRLVYVESFCRTSTLSLAGRLIYPISDEFFVQWPKLHEKHPKTKYVGLLSY